MQWLEWGQVGDPSLFGPSVPNQGTIWVSSATLDVGQANPVLITPKSLAALPMLKDVGCITTRFPSNSGTCTSFLLRAANAVSQVRQGAADATKISV